MTTSRRLGLSRDLLRLMALVALCYGLLDQFGDYSDIALLAVLVSVGLMGLSLHAPRGTASPAAYAVTVGVLAALQLRYRTQYQSEELIPVMVLAIAAPVACLAKTRRLALSALTCAAAASAVIVALPWRWGRSPVDAFAFVQTGAGELLHGRNPYGPLMPTYVVYNQPQGRSYATLDSVLSHFDYEPAVALLALPGRAIGDARLMSVVFFVGLFVAAAMLAARAGDRGRIVRIAALCAAFPLTAGMVISSWVDVYTLAGFSAWLVLRERRRRLAVAALAIAMATKPTIAPLLLPFVIWSPLARREVVVAGLASLALMLPFVIATGPSQFLYDVIGVDLDYPTRFDALTLNAFAHWRLGGVVLPAWLGLAVVGVAALAVLRSRPRDYADLLGPAAMLTTVVFLVSKWAYLNYYFLAAFALVLGSAGEGVPIPVVGLPHVLRWPLRLRREEMRRAPAPSPPA